ncbi:MAG: CoA-binding protein [Microthrixaceae bacterium]
MNDTELDDNQLTEILEEARTIAVYGASTNPDKAAHQVPAALIRAGYTVIPVHRTATEILGQKAYPTLGDIPVPVDIVDVFRPSAEVAGVVEKALAIGAPTIWVQQGITSDEGRRLANQAGVNYVEDNCLGATVQRKGITVA